MSSLMTRSAVGLSALALIWLTGCQQPHNATAEPEVAAKMIGCKLCYDRTITVRRMNFKGLQFARRRTIVKHMCPDCKVETEIYTEGDKLMMKCAKCAPEGIPCDKCLPPT